ncbi:MAG: hypothetical protein ACNA8O_01235 [Cyanobacteriota bacterium]
MSQCSLVKAVSRACLALGLLGWCGPVWSQRVPQITGWTFSRSSGSGTQNRTAVSSRSDSSGVQVVIESGNVELIQRPDGSSAYRIIDPSQKFGSFSDANRSDERSRSQGLSFFSLSDWGYSVFTY